MNVSDEQLFEIQGYLLSNGITDVGLQEDLADHICCVVEEIMSEGLSFGAVFEQAKERIVPDSPAEIQSDLNYLLTIKKKIMTRKLVFLFGFFGILELMLALALRVANFVEPELAGLLAMAGILTLSVSVVPYWVFLLYKRSVQKLKEA